MNWSMYNDSLVKRGEILLDFTVLEGWDREVERMNAGRRGKPFTYPDSLIRLLAPIRLLFHLPYRQLEGFTRGLSKYVEGLAAPDYTTLDRRVNRLNLNINDALISSDDPVYVALDSTGIKVHKSGDWIRRRFKVKKGYLKVHIFSSLRTWNVDRRLTYSQTTLFRHLRTVFITILRTPLYGGGGRGLNFGYFLKILEIMVLVIFSRFSGVT